LLKTLGKWHPLVAKSYNNIGSLWEKKGEYDKALEFYQKCLDIELKTLGAEHPYVAESINYIALVKISKKANKTRY
jgi:tetratricopeptide (TPR) repeat protein